MFLICEKDNTNCLMLKAALSAVTKSFDANGWNRNYSKSRDAKTALCVAVRKRNVEMVKLLLIHGADPSRCTLIGPAHPHRRTHREQNSNAPGAVLTAFDILDKEKALSESDEAELKRQISEILKSSLRWFPELIDFYPRRMGESLTVIIETLSDEHFPEEIIHFVIEYFCEP